MGYALTFISLVLCPVASIPFILYEIYRGRRVFRWLLALVMALLSTYYMPFGDQYAYWKDFQVVDELSLLFQYDDIYRRCSLVILIMSLVRRLGGLFEHVRIFCVFLAYVAIFHIYGDFCRESSRDVTSRGLGCNFFYFLVVFACVPFLAICQGYRQGVGACLGLAGIYFLTYRQYRVLGLLYLIGAIGFHVSCIVFFLAYCLRKLVPESLAGFIKCSGVSMCTVWLIDVAYNQISPILPDKMRFLDAYLSADGSWRDISHMMSIRHFVVFWLCRINMLIASGVLFCKACQSGWRDRSGEFLKVVIALSIVWMVFLPFFTISWRLYYTLMCWFAFSLLLLDRKRVWIGGDTKVLALFLFCAWMYVLPIYKMFFLHLDVKSVLKSNVVQMVSHTYDDDYVDENIDNKGVFYDDEK